MSCGLHDSIRLEARGVPVAMIVTDAFVRSVAEQLEVVSAGTFVPVYVPHPLASLPADEVHARADAALADVVARLVAGGEARAPVADRGAPAGPAAGTAGIPPAPLEAGDTSAAPGNGPTCPVDAGPDCEECAVDAAERGL